MIQAELRYLHSPDVDLPSYTPEAPENFGILVQAMIGPQGKDGEESFDFFVCSPQWLANKELKAGYIFGRHYLFLASYDYGLLHQSIIDLCSQSQGSDWETVANCLGRYGKWEFEDYRSSDAT